MIKQVGGIVAHWANEGEALEKVGELSSDKGSERERTRRRQGRSLAGLEERT